MNVKSRIGQLIGESINVYNSKLKPMIEEVNFKEEYQERIIKCMIGEVDDNYIETPEVTEPVFKLEYSKEGLVKLPTVKGKTILVDADGNETSTSGEGCRLMSVGEKEDDKLIITSKNKNLVNLQPYEVTKYGITMKSKEFDNNSIIINGTGNAPNNTIDFYVHGKWGGTDPILTLQKGKNYQLHTSSKLDVEIYYINGTTVLPYTINNLDKDTPITGIMLRVKHEKTYEDVEVHIQIEENIVKSSYVPHQSHKVEVLLNEPLRSLPNGVCDEIIGNQLIRRVGNGMLTGREVWKVYAKKDNIISYVCYSHDILTNMTPKNSSFGNLKNTNCNSLNESNNIDSDCELYCTHKAETYNGWIVINVLKEKLISEEVDAIEKYLSENPITILYELAESIIEELPTPIALQCFDDTTMYIENSITPTVTYGYNTLIPYKEELAKQREEVNNNVLDIETNIIPYLTEIEYNLNRMEGN